jgi:hypothetical protein
MPTGFESDGVDFDDLFDPDVMGDGPQATWLENSGVPLRYAALAYGTKRADVGYEDNGVDVSNLWAAKGTAVYALPINGQSFSISNIVPPAQQGSAAITFYIKSDGTYELQYSRTHGGGVPSVLGTWLPNGSAASEFQVRFTRTHTGGTVTASIGFNDAPNYVSGATSRGINLQVGPSGAQSGSRQSNDTITVEILRVSSGTLVSTTQFHTDIETDGSA